ncbi:MAG: glycerol-3-phosphate acyltransferase [Chloroflexi bacterium]|nr:glycerol-3-phosphate acyltransferase [Chloroflexota bacterium]
MIVVGFLAAFWCGALPFSYWIGRLTLRTDIRRVGDGNPGATNVFRAGGRLWGVGAVLLDVLKGAVPVGLANFAVGWHGWQLALVAVAPVLGHAFSPFLRGRGGKAVVVTFGIWTGLTIWEAPVVLGLMLLFWFRNVVVSGWAVLLMLASLLVYLLLARPDPTLLLTLLGNTLILAWKHRADLSQPPVLRSRKGWLWRSRSYS